LSGFVAAARGERNGQPVQHQRGEQLCRTSSTPDNVQWLAGPASHANLIGPGAWWVTERVEWQIWSAIDPKLVRWRNNGGATQTHALAPDSPAIQCGKTPVTPSMPGLTKDQRGGIFARNVGGVDISVLTKFFQDHQTWVVDTTDDFPRPGHVGRPLSLREALELVNQMGGRWHHYRSCPFLDSIRRYDRY